LKIEKKSDTELL